MGHGGGFANGGPGDSQIRFPGSFFLSCSYGPITSGPRCRSGKPEVDGRAFSFGGDSDFSPRSTPMTYMRTFRQSVYWRQGQGLGQASPQHGRKEQPRQGRCRSARRLGRDQVRGHRCSARSNACVSDPNHGRTSVRARFVIQIEQKLPN